MPPPNPAPRVGPEARVKHTVISQQQYGCLIMSATTRILTVACAGCLGNRGACIQAPSDQIKITINNESMSHVCAGKILTQRDIQSCQLVSFILNIYVFGRYSQMQYGCSHWQFPNMYSTYTRVRTCVCVSRWVRGWLTVGMWTIVIVNRRQVAWMAIYFIQHWL